MNFKFRYILTTILAILAIALNACGASSSNASAIGTAVALTVQAQNTQQAQYTPTALPVPANTNIPSGLPSPALGPTSAPPTAPPTGASGTTFCTASAAFVSETVPDGTIEQPGASFTKTWTIKNTGTCPWNSTWQFVYVSGDVMGGAFVYNFPVPAAPGDSVEVPIVFVAPTADGQYTGYWKIKSPWGLVFGDQDSGNPFWVQIDVGSGTPGKGTATAFGVTSVSYDISHSGTCTSANIFYTITATITTNGPLTISYEWLHSDGPTVGKGSITFAEATSRSVSDVWSVHLGSSNSPRWDQFIITSPFSQSYSKESFTYPCH